MNAKAAEVVSIARDYYNSDDADNFYHEIWGGEDIHIGLYRSTPDQGGVACRPRRDTGFRSRQAIDR